MSGLSKILYALRVNEKKDGKSPFEKHMGKEPNTVQSNVVKRFMDISARDPIVEFQPSDFQDELESTILDRERANGFKLEATFTKRLEKSSMKRSIRCQSCPSRPKRSQKRTLRAQALATKKSSRRHQEERSCPTQLINAKPKSP